MKITNVDRETGKTAYLIQKSAKENKPILVTTVIRARRLVTKAHELGYVIPTPISVYDLIASNYTAIEEIKNGILVDEFDAVFETLMLATYGLDVDEVTCSIDKSIPFAERKAEEE